MIKTSFTLISKELLTHDVYELIYTCPEMNWEPPIPGQYVMFQLAPGLSRAYSISQFGIDTFSLIIKRIEQGRGSPIICDAPVGTVFSGMLPLWHFTLRDTSLSKCFIGTGTGFAPLYCQMLASSQWTSKPEKVAFIFWVRNFSDSFYEDEIKKVGARFSDFEYIQYFSQETDVTLWNTNTSWTGYVTDWISKKSVEDYEEFYICGSPGMVKDARTKLESLGMRKEQIFWEQY